MFTLFGIGFAQPLLLAGFIAVPILWVLLRAVPPAPVRRLFPGVTLLLGLQDKTNETQRTPWWLLVLRALAVAALILAFAGPVLNPRQVSPSKGPILLVMDASWQAAGNWTAQRDRALLEAEQAGRQGRPIALMSLTDAPPPEQTLDFETANALIPRLTGLRPQPWLPDVEAWSAWSSSVDGEFDTIWLTSGADWGQADLLAAFEAHGDVRVIQDTTNTIGLVSANFVDGAIEVTAARRNTGSAQTVTIQAIGPDPAGVQRVLAQTDAMFAPGAVTSATLLDAPPELRNRFRRFAIAGQNHAGAVHLTDDALKRREVALFAGRDDREGLQLLSPSHYLRQALVPSVDLLEGDLGDILPASPDAIILADVATLTTEETEALSEWVKSGGLLIRFAGPRLANRSGDQIGEDPLLPVRLRAGGRSIGGAMSWGTPRALQPFEDGSTFAGLSIPPDVEVTAQVLAQPDPDLAARTVAALDDGTPLVTRKALGSGQVVLFHITANAEWSSLPLSGLFVQMLERLISATHSIETDISVLEGSTWRPQMLVDAFGQSMGADDHPAVRGEDLAVGVASAKTPPGIFVNDNQSVALNVMRADTNLAAVEWPSHVLPEGVQITNQRALAGVLFLAALVLLSIDALASVWLSGRWPRVNLRRNGSAAAIAIALVAIGWPSPPPQAQEDIDFALRATAQTELAYVLTGDQQIDSISHAGLRGLSQTLFARTSVEPGEPIGVNIETDELSFFPLLYWPIERDQPIPSNASYARLNRYLRGGGMIVFDTRDAGFSGLGGTTANSQRLQTIALPLDIPPLEPVPSDHILTRTFYLLQDFPGRFTSRDVWVEAAPLNAERADGMPFRNLNDNVTPVVIGGNDWASAWAIDANGNWMYPVGRGLSGERQRELALRFGVNLVMHVLTGNYKSDQVHVPALLDRLGQ